MGRRILSAICVIAAVLLVYSALPSIDQAMHTRPGDGVIDWLGARAWRAHVNIYSHEGLVQYGILPYGFAHPPTAPFWLLPFTHWEVDPFGTMMGWCTVLLTLVHCFATFSTLRLGAVVGPALLAFGLVGSSSWFLNDLLMAQVSEPIAIVYLLGWLALRAELDVFAGIAIGLACTFKPFAGVLWLMLLSLRRWRAAAAGVLAWLLIAAIMTARFGLVAWLQWNEFNQQTAIVWLGHLRNATLPGLVLRAFYPSCLTYPRPHLAPSIVAALLGLAVLVGCHLLSRTARPGRPHDPQRIDLIFAAWATASVFVNPVAWEHYAFILITPIAIVLATVFDPPLCRRERLVAAGAVLVTVLLLGIDMHAKIDARDRCASVPHGQLKVHLYAAANWLPWAVVLLTAMWLLRCRDRALRPS